MGQVYFHWTLTPFHFPTNCREVIYKKIGISCKTLEFADFNNYERDKNNDAIPRMEIDWIRTYINKSSVEEYDNNRNRNKTKFY